jgi:pimeloyl-ACP methyl ester carboxylesterase
MMLHGHRMVYRVAGSGPAVLLVHGLFEDSLTWRKVIPALARTHTVIAPDLLGHGESDGPPGMDYSPAGHAGTLRDLLDVLGHDRVTVVGHSPGGGVAMSFAYHYPGRVGRMALIASGGLGREVHPLLRALSLPGAGPALRVLTIRPTLSLLAGLARLAKAAHAHKLARIFRDVQLILASIGDRERRAAKIRTLRSVVGRHGQRVSAIDRLYLLRRIPTLVLWGTHDRMVPARHASAAGAANPGAEIVLLDGAGHLPHLTRAETVAERLSLFLNDAAPGAPIVAGDHGHEPSPARRRAPSPVRAADVPI